MNKIAIPAILVATVMVAGMFAFAPVEQASTVHTSTASIAGGAIASASVGGDNDVTVFDISSSGDVARGTICVKITDGGSGTTTGLVTVLAGGASVTLINNSDSEAGACELFATDKLVIVKPGEATGTDEIEYDASWVRDDA